MENRTRARARESRWQAASRIIYELWLQNHLRILFTDNQVYNLWFYS